MTEWLARYPDLPALASAHLRLAMAAVVCGVLISVPLGLIAARYQRLGEAIAGVAGSVQTAPGLALLALMVPLMGGRIGFWPAFAALTLYSVLPILRNVIIGVRAIPEDVSDAARVLSLNWRQRVGVMELPLAAPAILAGVRTASVWVFGAATLATPVGARSLGNYIFAGLQTRDWERVVVGCVAAMVLALVVDRLIAALSEDGRARRSEMAAGVVLLATGLSPMVFVPSKAAVEPQRVADAAILNDAPVVLAAKPFTEQYVLAELMAERLRAAGLRPDLRAGLGSAVIYDALGEGAVDVYVDYTGTLWANVLKRTDSPPRDRLYAELAAGLLARDNVAVLGRLGFENAYAFVVRQDARWSRASELGQDAVTVAGDPKILGRPEWMAARRAYGLERATTRTMDSTFLYQALANGEVDVVIGYTTDGRIPAFDLRVLRDDRGAWPPYDAIVLLSADASRQRAIGDALRPLLGRIDNEAMAAANQAVDLEGVRPATAARTLSLKP
ncbi:MAG: ABC transporter permease/substrate-binding protein [Maricaulaceae bacterium]